MKGIMHTMDGIIVFYAVLSTSRLNWTLFKKKNQEDKWVLCLSRGEETSRSFTSANSSPDSTN